MINNIIYAIVIAVLLYTGYEATKSIDELRIEVCEKSSGIPMKSDIGLTCVYKENTKISYE